MISYSEKLKDPRWQRKRLEVLQRSDFSCECCQETEKTLHVHHKFYKKGAAPWEYDADDLQSLCEDCHDLIHFWKERLNESIKRLELSDIEQLCGYAEAMLAINEVFSDDENIRNDKNMVWDIKSHPHAFGFGARLKATVPLKHQEQLINSSPLSPNDIFSLATDK